MLPLGLPTLLLLAIALCLGLRQLPFLLLDRSPQGRRPPTSNVRILECLVGEAGDVRPSSLQVLAMRPHRRKLRLERRGRCLQFFGLRLQSSRPLRSLATGRALRGSSRRNRRLQLRRRCGGRSGRRGEGRLLTAAREASRPGDPNGCSTRGRPHRRCSGGSIGGVGTCDLFDRRSTSFAFVLVEQRYPAGRLLDTPTELSVVYVVDDLNHLNVRACVNTIDDRGGPRLVGGHS
mmetsp:Transcript_46666/g.134414  ORF Transcript_46666/g.134414 Transcript_46666/m.134414 type:complete len:234 (+) Transcript_46666:493-1194(+)